MECFIYAITNIATGRRYVGSTINAERRWKQHQHTLKQNRHHCTHLQNSYNKHGRENFTFSIIRTLVTNDSVVRANAELAEIAKFHSFNTMKASIDLQSFETPPEVRAKKSAAAKRNWQDEGVRQKRLDRTYSDECLASKEEKMRIYWAKTEALPAKERQKAAVQAYWNNPEFRKIESRRRTGSKQSDETKKKKSEAHKKAWINPTDAMLSIASNTAASWTDPAIRQLRLEKMKAAWVIRKARGDIPGKPSAALLKAKLALP